MKYFNTPILFVVLFLLAFTSAKAEIRIDTVHCICGPTSLGGITIIATGAAGPFAFQWSGPEEEYNYITNKPSRNLRKPVRDRQTAPRRVKNPGEQRGFDEGGGRLGASGLYEVAVVNAYGCAVTLTTEVGECPVIDPLLLTPTPACTGANNGAITLTPITTGAAPYTYAWSTGATTESINNLAPGEYCLTVTDANGCTEEACATITSGQALDLDAQITNACGAEHNGSIMLTVSGGSGVYGYRWHDENIDTMYEATRSNLAPGIYNVTVNDEADCTITGSFEIIAHTPPVIASAQVALATCATAGDGAIALTVSGGAAPYTYAWSHGANTASIQNINGAAYCVTVTDANNCPVTACYSTLPTTPQDAAPYVKRVRVFPKPRHRNLKYPNIFTSACFRQPATLRHDGAQTIRTHRRSSRQVHRTVGCFEYFCTGRLPIVHSG